MTAKVERRATASIPMSRCCCQTAGPLGSFRTCRRSPACRRTRKKRWHSGLACRPPCGTVCRRGRGHRPAMPKRLLSTLEAMLVATSQESVHKHRFFRSAPPGQTIACDRHRGGATVRTESDVGGCLRRSRRVMRDRHEVACLRGSRRPALPGQLALGMHNIGLALMPCDIATLATDAPSPSHEAITCAVYTVL